MTFITGSARLDAEQRLDSIGHHLSQLRALVTDGDVAVDQSSAAGVAGDGGPELGRSYESVVAETFGRWVLDLLGLGESDPSDAVRPARMQLVGALSKIVVQTGQPGAAGNAPADAGLRFVDVFAGDDFMGAPDEELGVKPLGY